MTKEQIEEHRELIKWFIDNPEKGVWIKLIDDWALTYSPQFYETIPYVQNDELAKYRKALVDNKKVFGFSKVTGRLFTVTSGHNFNANSYFLPKEGYEKFYEAIVENKTIQVNTYGEWRDISNGIATELEVIPLENIRIKPEEPKFKVGDWVVHPGVSHPLLINQNLLNNLDNTLLKLWKPKVGEWCIFWNREGQEYFIYPFKEERDGRYITRFNNNFKHMAPLEFIQTLKGIKCLN